MTDVPLVEEEAESTNRFRDIPLPGDLKDSSAFDTKPTNAKAKKTPTQKKSLPPWRAGAIASWVEQCYVTVGGIMRMNNDLDIARIGEGLISIAEPAGKAWEKLAKRHEWLRRVFDRLMTSSDLAEIFWLHVPVFIPILSKWGPFRQGMDNIAQEFATTMREEAS